MNFNNKELIKALTISVCIKRYRTNSCLIKQKAYIACLKFGYKNPREFTESIRIATELGWIHVEKGYYRVISLTDIIKNFNEITNLFIFKHNLIGKGKSISIREVKNEINNILIIDNVINKQKHVIDNKKKYIELLMSTLEWIKGNFSFKGKRYFAQMKKILKKFGSVKNIAKEISIIKDGMLNNVVTSIRQVSNVTGLSKDKGTSILNNLKEFKRHICFRYVPNADFFTIGILKEFYPKAVIIPQKKMNRTKICFGSIITGVNEGLFLDNFFSVKNTPPSLSYSCNNTILNKKR